jgi:riboflavin synthase
MFTGLIEDLGIVSSAAAVPQGARLTVRTKLSGLTHGASIAVDGACLTAIELPEGAFAADVSAETLLRTTLGSLKAGDCVNLERPLALGDRLGGHLVLGHVDGVGEISARELVGNGERIRLRLPPGLAQLVVEKGSIALDGISLTVNEILGEDAVSLMIIPETLRATTWGARKAGSSVNVEADILGKHVARLLEYRST